MKKLCIIIFLGLSTSGVAQCTIEPFIQDNYLTDAWTMVFREFADDPSHPDYDIPILDEQKTIPFLEKISAVYAVTDTNPVADSLFTEFAIHASSSVPLDIVFGELYLEVDENEPWVL
ncbi:MAG: hypothetical protein R3359_12525, partial [Marinirhabdus sp.]|nr:hypothetical protein [Marinirhabdus sp.]